MPRAGLSPEAVVELALELVDESGVEALTLSAVADRAGVRTPSLYKHVTSLADLRERMAVRAIDEIVGYLEERIRGLEPAAGRREIMRAYRRWAGEHPERYRLVPVRAPEPGSVTETAADRFVGVVASVLDDLDLSLEARVHAVRAMRAAIHGFSDIEAAGGYGLPVGIDESYEFLVQATVAGIEALARA